MAHKPGGALLPLEPYLRSSSSTVPTASALSTLSEPSLLEAERLRSSSRRVPDRSSKLLLLGTGTGTGTCRASRWVEAAAARRARGWDARCLPLEVRRNLADFFIEVLLVEASVAVLQKEDVRRLELSTRSRVPSQTPKLQLSRSTRKRLRPDPRSSQEPSLAPPPWEQKLQQFAARSYALAWRPAWPLSGVTWTASWWRRLNGGSLMQKTRSSRFGSL
mmetsp:Transcript_97192/g.202986  ORF Transcript_97192/g.202986 Transcript_97192/m.202986 type:complete len:219 (+) Transcript_97192:264-920(+)